MPERVFLPNWDELRAREQKKIEELQQLGWQKARIIADYLKQQWQVEKVWLIGSLAQGRFGVNSDLDLVISGFKDQQRYFKVLDDCLRLADPFSVDLLLAEELPPGWEKNLRNGVEI
ncbi:Predicted nucleotidyltransferase [Carboxydocella sporoproducens DSM 16521]|uniref:Predicted nucleotidyltransferase n=2 Tax=Carboxydocella TaxID=178898 RepID=A0A1T4QVK5_9FIRM|nr:MULTISPECIES: nucleotidyltransferase domain-containing protein [Carboxydocella]AVX21670.1 putative nucleotidyltransferase [Carboxydocella thermautotrophica]AVX32081.1 putative nucleotidyltransferase [Carboxydocella thermautotrophica]SKA07745.1 Predicted nucleotidyltransferase [Carboxydocella sporoproducens DSM 16521]